MIVRRERDPFPSLFGMTQDRQITELTGIVNTLLSDNPDYFLVDIKINPGNNVKVFVDGDNGISINQCATLNRALYKKLEEGFFANADFSLEVSSPGLDEPLKLLRQYKKNTGRYAEVLLKDGIKRSGKIVGVSDEEIVLEESKGKGKKKSVAEHKILLDNIKTTKIQIRF